MLVRNYAKFYLAGHLLCSVLFGVGLAKSNQTLTINVTLSLSSDVLHVTQRSPYISHLNVSVQRSSYSLQPTVSASSYQTSITTSSKAQRTTITSINEDKKMKGHVIIIIVTVAAIALFTIVVVLLFCIFRRRRIQRLERNRNQSYNNMNYESTVKFRVDKNGESGNVEGTSDDVFSNSNKKTVPAKIGNNNPPNQGYEIVDLPHSSSAKGQKREYENVTPQNVNGDDKDLSSRKPYENVTPIAMTSEDNKKTKPINSQNEPPLLLSSPSKSNEQKPKDKHYENIDLPNLSE